MPDCTAGLRFHTLPAITVIKVPPLRGLSSATAPLVKMATAAVAVSMDFRICFIVGPPKIFLLFIEPSLDQGVFYRKQINWSSLLQFLEVWRGLCPRCNSPRRSRALPRQLSAQPSRQAVDDA
jgi:hypothetical protein